MPLRDWPKAIEVYRTLSGFFADKREYGLRWRKLKRPRPNIRTRWHARDRARNDASRSAPDIVESMAATALSDYRGELASISNAARQTPTQKACAC